jgi:hypothetical protein
MQLQEVTGEHMREIIFLYYYYSFTFQIKTNTHNHLEENFIRIRGAMLVGLSTFKVPLRPQNWRLLVVPKELSSLEEKKVLKEYNEKYYSDKADFVTRFLVYSAAA